MNKVSWIHLSDLHYCEPRTGWDSKDILEKLILDLKNMEKEIGVQPDFLFFTGDMAFGEVNDKEGMNLDDQYEGINIFLKEICKSFKKEIPRENIFLVPGNHDVNRKLVNKALTKWLDDQEDENEITEMIKNSDQLWDDYMRRLTNYRSFLENNGFDHLLCDSSRLLYSVKREVGDICVGIGGFNSVWSCCRPSKEEKANLWLGAKWQLKNILSNLKETDFNIALIHHPPNWFVEREDKSFLTKIQEIFRFCLHGHEHDEWVTQLTNGHTMISSDSCYGGVDEKNGYNIVCLDFDEQIGKIWLREYRSSGTGGWVPNLIPEITDNSGLIELANTNWMNFTKFLSATPTLGDITEQKENFKNGRRIKITLEGSIELYNQEFISKLVQSISSLMEIEPKDIRILDVVPTNNVNVELEIPNSIRANFPIKLIVN
ncbi:Metallophosphoesterase domain protein [Candidatus Magnetomorum sp. HK-1]|nr:Metallophosphoesterase domain protein [Candidatus Magnetomorum sp. HK-1]